MNKQDFIDNIGKVVYRDNNGCSCPDCKNIQENGVIIRDKPHAEYLADIQAEFANDGFDLNYRLEQ